jgi:hypothetical protein
MLRELNFFIYVAVYKQRKVFILFVNIKKLSSNINGIRNHGCRTAFSINLFAADLYYLRPWYKGFWLISALS